MSWSTKVTGKKAHVLSHFKKNVRGQHAEVADAVGKAADGLAAHFNDENPITVSSFGHIGTNGDGSASVSVQLGHDDTAIKVDAPAE